MGNWAWFLTFLRYFCLEDYAASMFIFSFEKKKKKKGRKWKEEGAIANTNTGNKTKPVDHCHKKIT